MLDQSILLCPPLNLSVGWIETLTRWITNKTVLSISVNEYLRQVLQLMTVFCFYNLSYALPLPRCLLTNGSRLPLPLQPRQHSCG
jgi:hypothetical protein